MKTNKIIFWIATGLLSAMMLMSVSQYFFNNAEISKVFTSFGYPTYLIYPLAIAKILGAVAILTRLSSFLKYFAYAGFFFNFTLAFFAHFMIGDGQFPGALMAMVFLVLSFIFDRRIVSASAQE